MSTYDKAFDPRFWERVRRDPAYARHLEDLHDRWNTFCTKSIEDIRYREFKQYYIDGNRRGYEKHYFGRHQGLNAACLMALIYPEKEEYLQRVQDAIFSTCNEFTWVLPAHQKVLEDFNPVHIDLFAAETGLNLSEVYMLLKDRLDPFIRRRVEEEVRRRILEPYKSRTFFWETSGTNWTAVCTCGVAIALMNVFPEEAKKLIPRFEAAAECFLNGYGDDGFCLEGPMYWNYGFGFFTAYAERLRSFGGIDHFQDPKVARIASFLQKTYLSEDVELTFADADMGTKYNPGILHFLHSQFPDTVAVPPERHAAFTDRMARMCLHLRSFLWFDPAAGSSDAQGVHYGADAQWLIVRKEAFGFAAKAGHNKEPHNHNDIGSFLFSKNGRQVITDPGRAEYCRDYFQEKRYEFLHASSRGHSVPIVGGAYQQPGREFAATDVAWDGKVFSMELAGAYGLSGLRSLRRSFVLDDGGVNLTDRIDSSLAVTERFVSPEEPGAEPGVLRWGDTEVTFSPAVAPTITRTEAAVEGGKTQVLYLIDIPLPPGTKEFAANIR